MTETQIEQLKKVLADSSLPQHSVELDDVILKSAHQAAQQHRANSGRQANRLFDLLPLAFLRTASLAIVLTVGVFLAMGQLVSVDQNAAVVDNSAVLNKAAPRNPSATMNTDVTEQITIASSQGRPLSTSNIALKPLPSGLSRDQILLNFELSDTEKLLATLSFEFNQSSLDRNKAELAMVDINSLIQVGELDNARKRYGDFINRCIACGLPETLEDLVLAAHNLAIKNSDFETG
jgi:hypothetical protein